MNDPAVVVFVVKVMVVGVLLFAQSVGSQMIREWSSSGSTLSNPF